MVCLAAVHPDRVCVLYSELGHRKWTGGVAIGDRDTAPTIVNHQVSIRHTVQNNSQPRIKTTVCLLTRVLERRLGSRVVFLLKRKGDGISLVCRLLRT